MSGFDDACLQGLTLKFYAARILDDDMLRPFRYCHSTWRDGAVAFRHPLIQISSRWEELGLVGSCPYPIPASDELLVHQIEFQSFLTAQELKQRLIYHLDTTLDGWVSTDLWEATKMAHKEAFNGLVQAVGNAESIDEKSRSEGLEENCPFDIGEYNVPPKFIRRQHPLVLLSSFRAERLKSIPLRDLGRLPFDGFQLPPRPGILQIELSRLPTLLVVATASLPTRTAIIPSLNRQKLIADAVI